MKQLLTAVVWLFGILLMCGLLPLIFFHNDTSGRKDLSDLAVTIDRLEKEHQDLVKLISDLEAETNTQHDPTKSIASSDTKELPKESSLYGNLRKVEHISDFTDVSRKSNPVINNALQSKTQKVPSSKSVLVVGGTGKFTF